MPALVGHREPSHVGPNGQDPTPTEMPKTLVGFGLTSLPGNPSSGPRRRGLPAPLRGPLDDHALSSTPGPGRCRSHSERSSCLPQRVPRHRRGATEGSPLLGKRPASVAPNPPISYNIGEVTLWNNCVATIPVRTVAPGAAAGLNSRRTMTEPIIGASRADGIPIRPRMSGVPMATTSNRTIARILRNLAGSRILPWRRTADPAPPALPGIPADRRPRTGTAGLGRSSLGKTCRSGRP